MVKIAIIGSGIGGLGTAHYLQQESDKFDIAIYERQSEVGGRIKSFDVDGYMVEIGAVYFHSINQMINQLVDDLSLSKGTMDRQPIGLWNGDKFLIAQGGFELWNNLKLLFKFGFTLVKLLSLVSDIIKSVNKFYEGQIHYNSIDEMLESADFAEIAKRPLEEILLERGLSQKLIDELIIPTARYVYHHSGTGRMNGFAGLVSLIAYDNSPVHFVEGGMSRITQSLVEKNDLIVKTDHEVTRIKKTNGKYLVETNQGSDEFDQIVLACPLSIADIELEGLASELRNDVEYRGYFKTIIVGDVDPAYFGKSSASKIPAMVLTKPKKSIPFYGFERLGTTDEDRPIYELTSTERLSDRLIEEMFLKVDRRESYSLPYTFPILRPPPAYDPIIVDDGFYYLSAIDMISPTLELSLMMGRNIANLILEK